jgi:hypothetical protein
MTAPRCGWFTLLAYICWFFCVVPGVSFAQYAETSNSQIYRDYRSALIGEGWKPVVSYGQKLSSGKPLYRFPEVVCGPQLCNAKWHDRNGKEVLIKLLRGYNGAEYRLAPQ